jgi:hypothetical protein
MTSASGRPQGDTLTAPSWRQPQADSAYKAPASARYRRPGRDRRFGRQAAAVGNSTLRRLRYRNEAEAAAPEAVALLSRWTTTSCAGPASYDDCSASAKQQSARGRSACSQVVPRERVRWRSWRYCFDDGATVRPRLSRARLRARPPGSARCGSLGGVGPGGSGPTGSRRASGPAVARPKALWTSVAPASRRGA